MERSTLINGGTSASQQEPGIRYGGNLVRDMTDDEVASCLQKAAREMQESQAMMQHWVMQHAQALAIANVLAFENERRTKKIRIATLVKS